MFIYSIYSMSSSLSVNVVNPHCTAEKLARFSKDHYTYINQIFGDMTVRDIIHEMYPSQQKYVFAERDIGYGRHHFLRQGKREICSADMGIQNMGPNDQRKQDKNDTLCQSYSLLLFMDKDIPKINNTDTLDEELRKKKSRQLDMIRMYRDILKRPDFHKKIKEVLPTMQDTMDRIPRKELPTEQENAVWMDYTQEPLQPDVHPYVNLSKLFVNIKRVLKDWESFGHWYFIRKGNCPPIAKTTKKRPRSLTPVVRQTRAATAAAQSGRTRSTHKNTHK